MKYTIFKIVKINLEGTETVVLSTNDETYAQEELEKYQKQASDTEFYIIVED